MTNLVLGWNTLRVQETVERWQRSGQKIKYA